MLQNLHTHTVFCDGKNTPREMIEKAIEFGFDSLGFSSHAKTKYNTGWEIRTSPEEYVNEINKMKKEYSDRIRIYVGCELDYYSNGYMPTEGLDYTIGAVHMLDVGGYVVDYDHSYEISKKAIDEIYRGNCFDYARDYYAQLVKMSREMSYDIVGHFDLLTKFSEKHPELIDCDSKEYRDAALEALYAVRERHEIFEVNTGAISRGHRTTPYPAPFILDEMKRIGCKLVLTSDCHNAEYLTVCFDKAKELLASHGFSELYYLTENGFVAEKI